MESKRDERRRDENKVWSVRAEGGFKNDFND